MVLIVVEWGGGVCRINEDACRTMDDFWLMIGVCWLEGFSFLSRAEGLLLWRVVG